MADAILGQDRLAGKPLPFAFNTTSAAGALLASANLSEPALIDGLVRHDYVDPDVQVTILAVVDETGSAALEDIATALPGHPKPVGAVMAMKRVGIVRIEDGVIDAHSRVCRARPLDHDDDDGGETPDGAPQPMGNDKPGGSGGATAVAIGVEPMREIRVAGAYAPAIFCVTGANRGTLRSQSLLNNPGFYIVLWGREVYVGASQKVADRLTKGKHAMPLRRADRIIAIVDRSGQLDWNGAQVAERLTYRQLTASGELLGRNGEPSGGQVDEATYKRVHDFVEASMAALRREGLVSPAVSASKGAGRAPRPEQALFATRGECPPPQPLLYRLDACGIEASARVDDTSWTLLAGSAVRGSVMRSAHPSAKRRRVELLHSGGLIPNGNDYLLTEDIQFGSATGAAHFILGSKTRADIWNAVDPSAGRPARAH